MRGPRRIGAALVVGRRLGDAFKKLGPWVGFVASLGHLDGILMDVVTVGSFGTQSPLVVALTGELTRGHSGWLGSLPG